MSEHKISLCPYTKSQILAVCVDGYCKYLLNSNLNPNSARSTKRATLGAATVCNIMKTSKAVENSIDHKMYGAMYDDACASERCDRAAADQRTAGDLVVLDKRADVGLGFSKIKKHVESRLLLARLPINFDRSMKFLKLSAEAQSQIRARLNGYDPAQDDFDKYARSSGIYDLIALSIDSAEFEEYVNIYLAGLRAALLEQYAGDDRLYSAVESAPTLAELMEVHQLDCDRCIRAAKSGQVSATSSHNAIPGKVLAKTSAHISDKTASEAFGESSYNSGSSVLDSIVANVALLDAADDLPKRSDYKVVIGNGIVNKIGGYEVDVVILIFVIFVVVIIILIMKNLKKIEHLMGFDGDSNPYNPTLIKAIGGNASYSGDNNLGDLTNSEDPLFVSTPEQRSFA